MNPPELETLINRHLDGIASAAEAATLSLELERDEDARRLYLQLARLHATLAAGEESVGAVPEPRGEREHRGPPVPPRDWLAKLWPRPARLMAAMLAGLVAGIAGTSVVWACARAARTEPVEMLLPVVDGGFESGAKVPVGPVPAEFHRWQGDLCEVVTTTGRVTPHGGRGMLRFVSVGMVPNEEDTKPICSDLWQVVPLPHGQPGTVKVRIWLNADTSPRQARFHLIAMAGAGDASAVPALWNSRFNEGSETLASGRMMKFVDADPATWEPAEVVLRVPAEARVLVVGIAAYRLPNVRQPAQWLPAQFTDDLTVTFTPDDAAR